MDASLPSERNFGWTFAAVGTLAASYLVWRGENVDAAVAALVAAAFVLVTLARPDLLRPLNRAWNKLGLLLARVINPIVLGILFFVLITPIALITRAFGRDELGLRRRPRPSYWKPRIPPGPPAESFDRQF